MHRAGYSRSVLRLIAARVAPTAPASVSVAEIGAGTGKLTEDLLALGYRPRCVEPNAAMRAEGARLTTPMGATWSEGSGEETGLPSAGYDWVLMASAFHWTDPARSLPEFHRVLRPGGSFTALWNPRDLERSEFHMEIERRIGEIVPDLKRVSSGGAKYTERMFDVMTSTGHFEDVILAEARHEVVMTRDRYLGAWRSVNDIQAQAGPERWSRILAAIESATVGMPEVVVPYRTRSFTARRVGT